MQEETIRLSARRYDGASIHLSIKTNFSAITRGSRLTSVSFRGTLMTGLLLENGINLFDQKQRLRPIGAT